MQSGTAQPSPEDIKPVDIKPNVGEQSTFAPSGAASDPSSGPHQNGPGSGGPNSVPSLSSSNTAMSFTNTDLLTDNGGNLGFDPMLAFGTGDLDYIEGFDDGSFGGEMNFGPSGGDDFGSGDFDFTAFLNMNNGDAEDNDGVRL